MTDDDAPPADQSDDTSGSVPAGTKDDTPATPPDPDQAWKALGLVNDWIRHADSKTGATLAASGATGTLLFGLMKDRHHPAVLVVIFAALCAVSVVGAAGCAAIALVPRTELKRRSPEDPTNKLYFRHIARAHGADDGPTYVEVLRTLTSDRDDLTRHIAHQVHANAVTAHRKFSWADRAIRLLVAALSSLAVTAFFIAILG